MAHWLGHYLLAMKRLYLVHDASDHGTTRCIHRLLFHSRWLGGSIFRADHSRTLLRDYLEVTAILNFPGSARNNSISIWGTSTSNRHIVLRPRTSLKAHLAGRKRGVQLEQRGFVVRPPDGLGLLARRRPNLRQFAVCLSLLRAAFSWIKILERPLIISVNQVMIGWWDLWFLYA